MTKIYRTKIMHRNILNLFTAILIISGFGIFAEPAFSQEAKMDIAEFQRCLEAADDDDNISRNECIGVASSKCIGEFYSASGKANCWSMENSLWDGLLNQEYRALMNASSSRKFKGALKNTQRAWIKYRNADCGLYNAMGIGGAPEAQLYESCNMNHTAKRANALQELLEIVRQVEN